MAQELIKLTVIAGAIYTFINVIWRAFWAIYGGPIKEFIKPIADQHVKSVFEKISQKINKDNGSNSSEKHIVRRKMSVFFLCIQLAIMFSSMFLLFYFMIGPNRNHPATTGEVAIVGTCVANIFMSNIGWGQLK